MNDKTKQKIQELVPEIMELKFGCEVKYKNTDFIDICVGKEYKNSDMPGCLFIPVSRTTINGRGNPEIRTLQILGRPITLADVLLAMEKVGKYILVDITGNLFTHDMSDGALVDEGIWDLTKNYDDQEQSVKDFIGQILGVK